MTQTTLHPFNWQETLATNPTVQLLQRLKHDPALTYADSETIRLAKKTLETVLKSVAPTDSPTDLMVRETLCQLLELDWLEKI